MKGAASELLEELLNTFPLKQRPTVVWRKMSVSAGRAYFHKWEISLSSVLIVDDQRMRDTLIHEYAHLLAFDRHGRDGSGHGQAWRQAMHDLGAKPIVRHSYEVERRAMARNLTYKCGKCGVEVFRVRPLKRGYTYFHRDCGGVLRKA